MRLVLLSVAALICWGDVVPAVAAEVVRMPISCTYLGNKVVLTPSPGEETYVIAGEREHKTLRVCAPGLNGRCRTWEVHRFDVMCGGKQVSWRLIAGQLLSLARRETAFRTHIEPWEQRVVLADTEFAPVDEFGGRILPFAARAAPDRAVSERDAPKSVAAREAVTTKAAAENATPPPSAPKLDPEPAPPKTEPARAADSLPFLRTVAATQPPPMAAPQRPAMPLAIRAPASAPEGMSVAPDAEKGDSKSATVTPFPANTVFAAAEIAGADAQPQTAEKPAQSRSSVADVLLIVSASIFLAVAISLMIFVLVRWWKPIVSGFRSPFRRTGEPADEMEDATEPDDAETAPEVCRELMKQITGDLVKAMTAVNGLKGAPALQAALYAELNSIRRSLGFTSQTRGAAGDDKDWSQIRTQLTLSLQGTQRIIGIADAARTSFSAAHPAALEVITTRLEAYAFLGVNASSSEMVLKKAVNALRQCWHPDLATDEEDRRLREIRIKQINAAWDLISRKQMSAC